MRSVEVGAGEGGLSEGLSIWMFGGLGAWLFIFCFMLEELGYF